MRPVAPPRSSALDYVPQLSDRVIRVQAFVRVGDVALPTLAAGTTMAGAAIVAHRVATTVGQWLGGSAITAPEALSTGIAAAGVAAFGCYTAHFLRLGRDAAVGQQSGKLTALRTNAFLAVPCLALAVGGSSWATLAAGAAALTTALGLRQWCELAVGAAKVTIAERD